MSKRRGFTLIELLVVITIIAVLLAILMPSLARARKQARAVACQALLRQWGTIWSMFCDDNNGFFSSGQVGWARGEWVINLRDLYQTKTQILQCPTATRRLPGGEEWGGPFNTYAMPGTSTGFGGGVGEEPSYGQNCWVYNPPQGTTNIQGRAAVNNWRTKDSPGAANIPVFADSMWRGGGPSSDMGSIACDPPAENGKWYGYDHEMKHFCIDRHSGAINMLFMDWHVERVGLKKLWRLKWHKNFDIHGGWTQPNANWPAWMKSLPEG